MIIADTDLKNFSLNYLSQNKVLVCLNKCYAPIKFYLLVLNNGLYNKTQLSHLT